VKKIREIIKENKKHTIKTSSTRQRAKNASFWASWKKAELGSSLAWTRVARFFLAQNTKTG
jgi:hypothetical protein